MSRLTSILAVMFLIAGSTSLNAQEAPKTGILIKMDSHELALEGGQAETKVYFLRSKRLRKVKLETPSVQQQDGLSVSLSPIADEQDAFLLTIKADDNFVGASTLMIDGVGRWGRDTKSTSFTVLSAEQQVASKNE